MYLYYFLSAFGPRMQPYLWWKKWVRLSSCGGKWWVTSCYREPWTMFQSIMTNSPIVWHRVMTATFIIDYDFYQVTKNHDHNSNHRAENHEAWTLTMIPTIWQIIHAMEPIMWARLLTMTSVRSVKLKIFRNEWVNPSKRVGVFRGQSPREILRSSSASPRKTPSIRTLLLGFRFCLK